jgi:hypothetical protein
MYNWHDIDEMHHGNGFTDFDLDYQLNDPMESNHYVQNRGILTNFAMAVVMFIFIVSKPFP